MDAEQLFRHLVLLQLVLLGQRQDQLKRFG